MPIIDFIKPTSVSKFSELVKTELDALLIAGDNKAVQITVPSIDANNFKVAFSKAANDANKTAKLQIMESDGKNSKPDENGKTTPIGDTKFVFTLTQRHARRRNKEVEDANKAAAEKDMLDNTEVNTEENVK